MKHRVMLGMLFAILTACVATVGVCGSANAIGPPPPQVTYQLSGSAPVADYISYQMDTGQVQQANVPLPWKTQFASFGGQVFVISAQSPGSITCTILLDGKSGQPGDGERPERPARPHRLHALIRRAPLQDRSPAV